MLYSVCIVSLNGAQVLPACLRAVAETRGVDFETIVVNNGSTDETATIVARDFPDVRLFNAGRNLGFAGGNNLAIEKAQGDVIVLLNDDTEVDPDWLEQIDHHFKDSSNIGIVGFKLVFPDGKIQHAGGLIRANGLTDHMNYNEEDMDDSCGPIEADYVTGAALAFRRELLEIIGPLDAGYFPIYFEEVDFCLQARRAGFRCIVEPGARVVHHESQQTGRHSVGYYKKYNRMRVRFVLKCFTGRQVLRALKGEARWLYRHRPWEFAWPLLYAYTMNALYLPATLRARLRAASRLKGRKPGMDLPCDFPYV